MAAELTSPSSRFDLLLKGGRVIDPASGRDGLFDVGISEKKIAAVDANIPAETAAQVVDVTGLIVTPGIIDMHTHVYTYPPTPTSYVESMHADAHLFASGVTTTVDAGTAGWRNFSDFKASCIDLSKVRILAYLNIAGDGMVDKDGEQVVERNATQDRRGRGRGVQRPHRRHQDRALLDAAAVGRGASALGLGRAGGGGGRDLPDAGHGGLLAAAAGALLPGLDPEEAAAGRHPHARLRPAVPHRGRPGQGVRAHVAGAQAGRDLRPGARRGQLLVPQRGPGLPRRLRARFDQHRLPHGQRQRAGAEHVDDDVEVPVHGDAAARGHLPLDRHPGAGDRPAGAGDALRSARRRTWPCSSI